MHRRSGVSNAIYGVSVIIALIVAGVAGYYGGQTTSPSQASLITRTTTATTTATMTVTAQATTSTGMQDIRISGPPTTDFTGVYMAATYGIFAKYGLNPVISVCPGSGACIEGLVSNQYDVVLAAPPAVISFASQTGTYLHFLAPAKMQGQVGSRTGDGPSFLVRTGLTINSPKDLAGKTILTNAIGGPNHIAPLYLLEKNGLSNSSVIWKQLSFGSMPAALLAGQADAASMAQPFAGAMLANHTAYSIDNLFGSGGSFVNALGNPALVSTYETTQQKYQQSPDFYNRFVKAYDDGLAYAYLEPDLAMAAVSGYTKTPVSVLSQLLFTQEIFYPYNDTSTQFRSMIGSWVNIMNYTGYLPHAVVVDNFFK